MLGFAFRYSNRLWRSRCFLNVQHRTLLICTAFSPLSGSALTAKCFRHICCPNHTRLLFQQFRACEANLLETLHYVRSVRRPFVEDFHLHCPIIWMRICRQRFCFFQWGRGLRGVIGSPAVVLYVVRPIRFTPRSGRVADCIASHLISLPLFLTWSSPTQRSSRWEIPLIAAFLMFEQPISQRA